MWAGAGEGGARGARRGCSGAGHAPRGIWDSASNAVVAVCRDGAAPFCPILLLLSPPAK